MDSYEASSLAGLAGITRRLAANAAEYDRSGVFPHDNIAQLREAGLIGLPAARILAGAPLSLRHGRDIITAVARGEPSTALVLIMTYLFTLQAANNPNWPPHVRNFLLEDIARNGSLANALRVEPELGTPVRGGLPKTIAVRVPGGFRISGRKLYSTGSPGLRWMGVWSRTDDAEPLVGTFLVPADAPGISIEETWDQLGLRASGSHDVILQDVFIPEDHALDIRTQAVWGTSRPAESMAWMFVLLGSLYDAVARNARDWLVQFALNRVPANLGAALSTLPRFQEALGEIDALLHVNQVLLDRATDDPEKVTVQESNFLKYVVTNNAIKVAERALSLTGNPGLARANPLERHYRDALCGRIHSPQDDTILATNGRAAFAAFSL